MLFCGSINFGGDGWVLSCYEKRDCLEFFCELYASYVAVQSKAV